MPSLKEVPDGAENCDSRRMAALLGVHLVSQVLDQACTLANAAQRIGWFKDVQSGRLSLSGCEDLFGTMQGDSEIINVNRENISHLSTSTPHKDEIVKTKAEHSFIGQGDEEFDMVSKDYEVHRDEAEVRPDNEVIIKNEAQMFSSYIILTIMDKIYETAFSIPTENEGIENEIKDTPNSPDEFLEKLRVLSNVFDENCEDKIYEIDEEQEPKNAEEYCYSFLDNEYESETGNDIMFYIDEDATSVDELQQIKVLVQAEIHTEIEELNEDNELISDDVEGEETDDEEDKEAEKADKLEAARYENAYLSLNRDYDQCSDDEDDGDPILQDPKPMQDVELYAALTEEDEEDDLSTYREPKEERKELAATSAISGASGSRKSRTSLVSRCRTQGARLLACLRGWWRRKTPGKRKEARTPGSVRGVCPLSPDARRRAASLLDQRHLYSPLPSRSVAWKFFTVNEAVVNSSKWKEYSFEVNPDECGEHC